MLEFHQVKYTETDVEFVWCDGHNFWFQDETGDLEGNGPYKTKEQAKVAMDAYIAYML